MPVSVPFTAELLEAFSGMFLSPRYDNPSPTAPFHREAWRLYCSDTKSAMVIAPRGHAKSTALSFAFILAAALFRQYRYIVLISSTEEMAQEQLSNIIEELHENEDLVREFGITSFPTDSKTDVVVELSDGYKFRIIAKGAEQRIRGRMWSGMRPDLIVCDDMEDDEQVQNADRRQKFRNWFFRAAKQSLGKKGRMRVHGTILHEDSLLAGLRKNSQWKHLFYQAHASFDDFRDILWPEQWSERALRAKRQEMIDAGDAAGYSQEMLNDPQDNSETYLRREDFIAMSEEDHEAPKAIVVGCDFAVSKADRANRTSFTVGGKCMNNLMHVVGQYVGRWDTFEWTNLLFDIQANWNPQYFFVEDGVIWKSVYPMIQKEMQLRNVWINFYPILSIKDKATRGRPFQKRMRGQGCRYDKRTEWYGQYEQELLKFTGRSDAALDDQFDSTAIIAKGLDIMSELDAEDFYDDEEIDMRTQDPRGYQGRSPVAGY